MEEYLDKINDILTAIGFTKIDDRYEISTTISGRTMVINGQQIQQQPITIKKSIVVLGDGFCSNLDDTDKRDMIWMRFETYQSDELVHEFSEGLYCGEEEYFKKLLQQWLHGN